MNANKRQDNDELAKRQADIRKELERMRLEKEVRKEFWQGIGKKIGIVTAGLGLILLVIQIVLLLR